MHFLDVYAKFYYIIITSVPAVSVSEPVLRELMNEVAAEIPTKWRRVGLELGLERATLDMTEKKQERRSDDMFRGCVVHLDEERPDLVGHCC